MALGFFRRRQKMVIIIMVVLMLSFLLGGYGVSTLLQRDPSKQVIADTTFGKMTLGEQWAAEADMAILRNLGLGTNPYRAQQWPLEMAYYHVLRSGGEREMIYAFALLLKEASNSGVVITEADVDEFFQMYVGTDENAYKSLISSLRENQPTWTEKSIRGAIADWLRIYRNYLAVRVDCPPSEVEIQAAFRDITEKISLQAVRFKAEDFLAQIRDPNQQAVKLQFEKFRMTPPGRQQSATEWGFGYRQPAKAALQYLLVNGEVIGQVAQPPFEQLVSFFERNKERFYREEPITPSTAPSTAPADANTPMRRVQLTFAEAKPQIIEELHETTVGTKVEELVALAQKTAQTLLRSGVDPNSVYEKVVEQMQSPAQDVLAKKLTNLKIEDATVSDAVSRLSAAAGLTAICFPWGTHGDQELDPQVKVTITGEMTLRAALDEVSRQAKWSRLEWARCQGMDNVIFSVARAGQGIDFFPFQAESTKLLPFRKFVEHPVIGFCYTSPTAEGLNLSQVVFSVRALAGDARQAFDLKVGEQGMPMYLVKEEPGRVLWRLTNISKAHVPTKLTGEIRDEVVRDLKMVEAMKLVRQKAVNVRDAAEKVGLATAAGTAKIDTFATGLFSRRQVNLRYTDVPMFSELDTPGLDEYFVKEAFALASQTIDATSANKLPVKIVPLQARGEMVVIERIGFEPVVRKDFEDNRLFVERFLNSQQQATTQVIWFNYNAITKRTKFAEGNN